MKTLFSVFLLIFYVTSAHANADIEQDYLNRILQEIAVIEDLIGKAEEQQTKKERPQEKFRYDWLRADLKKIESGIKEKFNLPSVQPRTYEQIQGQYLEHRDKKATVTKEREQE